MSRSTSTSPQPVAHVWVSWQSSAATSNWSYGANMQDARCRRSPPPAKRLYPRWWVTLAVAPFRCSFTSPCTVSKCTCKKKKKSCLKASRIFHINQAEGKGQVHTERPPLTQRLKQSAQKLSHSQSSSPLFRARERERGRGKGLKDKCQPQQQAFSRFAISDWLPCQHSKRVGFHGS